MTDWEPQRGETSMWQQEVQYGPGPAGDSLAGNAMPADTMPEWAQRCEGEPALQELLDDPIMGLLWQRDRLEPRCARQRIGALRLLVRRTWQVAAA